MSRTVIISCGNVSARLKYVSNFIFEQLGGFKIQWLDTDESVTEKYISYGVTTNLKAFQILPDGYLEKGKNLDWQINGELPEALDQIDEGFDYFSFIFRHLSRFEEVKAPRDLHGRFMSHSSWNGQNGWLRRPVVDRVIQELFSRLNTFYDSEQFQIRTNYRPELTIDIDLIFAYKRRGLLLSVASGLKDVLWLRWQRVGQRLFTILGWQADPYDETHWMTTRAVEEGVTTRLFFLVGGQTDYDRQGKLLSSDFADVDQNVEIALHPSYASINNSEMIATERSKLTRLSGRRVSSCRFHYLRMRLPDSYQILKAINFEKDYSMIYVDDIGFRAGTCHEFHYYDLEHEEVSPLKVVPGVAMDVTLKDKLALGQDEAVRMVGDLVEECKTSKGIAAILWHNSSFDKTEGWKGWRDVFIRILREMGNKRY